MSDSESGGTSVGGTRNRAASASVRSSLGNEPSSTSSTSSSSSASSSSSSASSSSASSSSVAHSIWRRLATLCFFVTLTAIFVFLAILVHIQIDNPCLLGRPGRWSVGMIYSTEKLPMNLHISALPVLGCTDVSDARNSYIADPFFLQRQEPDPDEQEAVRILEEATKKTDSEQGLVLSVMGGPNSYNSKAVQLLTSPRASTRPRNGKWFMFFEVLNTDTDQGDIGMAWSNDPMIEGWHYQEIVLDEPYHLSYPFVFHWQGNYYMIPESHQDKSIRLYKASPADFPHKWTFVKVLLGGQPFIDTSPVFHNGVWYLFTYVKLKSSLLLYYSTSPNIEECEWRVHPSSPLYTNDARYSRPGGRPFVYRMPVEEEGTTERMLKRSMPGDAKTDGTNDLTVNTADGNFDEYIIRFTQNDVEKYGHYLHMMRVKVLTPEKFEESELFAIHPIPEFKWISERTHHIDLHFVSRTQDERKTLETSTFTMKHNNPKMQQQPDGSAQSESETTHLWMGVLDGNYHHYNPDQFERFNLFGIFSAYFIIMGLFLLPEKRQRFRFVSQKLTQYLRGYLLRWKAKKLISSSSKLPLARPSSQHSASKLKYTRSQLPSLLSRFLLGLLLLLALSPFFYALSGLSFTTHLPAHPRQPLFNENPPAQRLSPPTPAGAAQLFAPVVPAAPPSSGPDSKVPCPVTLVTALYDIGRGDPRMGQDKMQPWSNYLHYFSLVLSVNSCQVIHVDASTADFVMKQRGCKARRGDSGWQEPLQNAFYKNSYRLLVSDCTYPTEIIVTSLADMKAESKLLPRITSILRSPIANRGTMRPNRVERRIPEYNMLMFSKLEWLMDAINRDPFRSKYFFWIDGGYGKGQYFRGREFAKARWPAVHLVDQFLPDDQFLIIKSREKLTHSSGFCEDPVGVARNHTTMLAGGFSGGSKLAVAKFLAEVRVTVDRALEMGLMDDDQSVLFYTYCRRPDLVFLLRCVHSSVVAQTVGLYPKWRWGHFHCPTHMFLDRTGIGAADESRSAAAASES